MSKDLVIRFREANETDVGFIFNSFLKSFRDSYFARNISSTIYFNEHHKIIESLLKKAKVNIACNPNDVSQIYGYVISEKIDNTFVLHYIYVKQTFRKMGIGKKLLEISGHDKEVAGCYSHHNKISEKLSAKYNLIYHPYLAMERVSES